MGLMGTDAERCYCSGIRHLSMKSLLALGALLLSGTPVFADVGPIPAAFTEKCMGSDEMEDDYRIQKSKYCDCMGDFIYVKYADQDWREIFDEVVAICKDKYPPLN